MREQVMRNGEKKLFGVLVSPGHASALSSLELYSPLRANAGVEGMFYFAHFSDEVGGFDKCGRSIATGDDDVQRRLRGADGAEFFEDFF